MARARRISYHLPMVTEGRRGIRRYSCLLLLILLVGGVTTSFLNIGGGGVVVEAFAPPPPVARRFSNTDGPPVVGDWLQKRRKHIRQPQTQQLFSNRRNENENDDENDNDDNDDFNFNFNWLSKRLDKADVIEIRNDAVLVACYVLCRFLIYDVATGTKISPGFEIQDFIWLTGTFSSATVLVIYWTLAGLLSRSYEFSNSSSSPSPLSIYQTLVNVTLCCPIWLATEHFLRFGPSNIGGDTLSIAIATGFIGLGSFMVLAKVITTTTYGGGKT